MPRTFDARRTSALLALRVLEFHSIDELATAVALIAPGIGTRTIRTSSLDKPVCQESVKEFAEDPIQEISNKLFK